MPYCPTTYEYSIPELNTIVLYSPTYSEYNDEFLYYTFNTKPIDPSKPYETNINNIKLPSNLF